MNTAMQMQPMMMNGMMPMMGNMGMNPMMMGMMPMTGMPMNMPMNQMMMNGMMPMGMMMPMMMCRMTCKMTANGMVCEMIDRAEDHQIIAPNYFGYVGEYNGKLKPIITMSIDAETATPPPNPACQMGELR